MFVRIETQSQQESKDRMIVCICRGASEREVRNAVGAGANCLEKLQKCGIGGDCGSCEDLLRDLMIEVAGPSNACRTCCAAESTALATA